MRISDKKATGLMPIQVDTWENFVFVKIDGSARASLRVSRRCGRAHRALNIGNLHFFASKLTLSTATGRSNADNYLDGGYHVPHLHKSLDTVIEYKDYMIENGDACASSGADEEQQDATTAAVRRGDAACTAGSAEFHAQLVRGRDGCQPRRAAGRDQVRSDLRLFLLRHLSRRRRPHNQNSLAVAQRIQQEDIDICESVQRDLGSRAYLARPQRPPRSRRAAVPPAIARGSNCRRKGIGGKSHLSLARYAASSNPTRKRLPHPHLSARKIPVGPRIAFNRSTSLGGVFMSYDVTDLPQLRDDPRRRLGEREHLVPAPAATFFASTISLSTIPFFARNPCDRTQVSHP